MHTRPRVAIVTNIIPHYRADFYRRIFANQDLDCHVFCQGTIPGSSIETAHHLFPGKTTLIRSLSSSNERIAFQAVPVSAIRSGFDMCFVYGNPRVVSNVLLSCALLALRFPVILWGQAHTSGGSPVSERLRLGWWRLFSNLFVYNDDEVAYLRERGFSRQVIMGMNNGLDQQQLEACAAQFPAQRLAEWRREMGLEDKIILLSCARLVPKNRFDLVIDSLPELLKADPSLVWCVLGDGSERERLEQHARRRDVSHAIRWQGAVHDENALAPWFMSSVALVHPAALGLPLLHAFGYGLPVVTHDDRHHQMPEITALKDGQNGLLFRSGDAQSLAEKLLALVRTPSLQSSLSHAALYAARTEFNTEVMARRFSDMVHAVWERTRGARRA
jgi:glycosyltransferase involved in cell wall biosynthesis